MAELVIIIPAYNAHSTIKKTLESIEKQNTKNLFEVVLVNDFGQSYQEMIKKYKDKIEIREINTKENKGPGGARQYGIENTESKFIVFIDADDCFYKENSVEQLLSQIKNTNADLVVSNFIYERDNKREIKKKDPIWLHGKIFRRSFLEEHEIQFNQTRANEDNGFNRLILLLNPEVNYLDEVTYVYKENPYSITRKENRLYKFTGLEGYAYNMTWAMVEAEKRNANTTLIAMTALATLYALYYYYLEFDSDYEVEKIIKWSKSVYDKYIEYEHLAKYYETQISNIIASQYNDKKIQKTITFQEFLKKVSEVK